MKNPYDYEKQNGMLLTLPEDTSEEDRIRYEKGRLKPQLVKYDRETFDAFMQQALKIRFIETRSVDRRDLDKTKEVKFTPENIVIYQGKLFAVLHVIHYANYDQEYFIPLSKLSEKPLCIDSSTYRFDDPGDHDSWSTYTYLKMISE